MRGPNRKATSKARTLRQNATDAETKLWFAVRDRRLAGLKFVRQKSIGPYVADFLCRDRNLIIEVDGGQHDEQRVADDRRTRKIEALVYRVLRFWNNEVLQRIDGVMSAIFEVLSVAETPPTPDPSPPRAARAGGGEKKPC